MRKAARETPAVPRTRRGPTIVGASYKPSCGECSVLPWEVCACSDVGRSSLAGASAPGLDFPLRAPNQAPPCDEGHDLPQSEVTDHVFQT